MPCAVGCTLRGQHATTCHGDCTGCLPAPVDPPATICRHCHARLRRDLTACPDLVQHITAMVEPGRGEPVEHRGRRPSPPAPLNVAAVAAADDLHAMLASWVITACRATGLAGPSRAGSRFNDSLDVVVGVRDPAATRTLVVWLLRHTDTIAAQEWAHEMVTEIGRTVHTLQARWPFEDRPVYLPVPCPACGCESLVRYSPKWVGAPVTITCHLTACGHVVPEDRYEWLIRLHKGAHA